MRKIVVGALVLLVALACLWSLWAGDEVAAPGAVSHDAGSGGPAAALAALGSSGLTDANEPDPSSRRAVEANVPRELAGDRQFAFVGRLVDEHGDSIEGALVTARPEAWYAEMDEGDAFRSDQVQERVQRVLRQSRSVPTDATGRFRIRLDSPAKQIQLRMAARGRPPLERSEERPVAADVDLGTLTMALGAVVSGRVLDRAGQPIASVRVSRSDAEGRLLGFQLETPSGDAYRELEADFATTDDDGAFELPNVPAGDFALLTRHTQYPTTMRKGLSVAAGAALADVLLVLDAGAAIRGQVTGAPPDATLYAFAVLSAQELAKDGGPEQQWMSSIFGGNFLPAYGQRCKLAAADGRFTLEGLAAGRSYRVWAVRQLRPGAEPKACCTVVDAPAGSHGIELRYDCGVTITALVVDERTGAPIERAWVRHQLQEAGQNVESMWYDPNGSAPLACPEGRLTLTGMRPEPKQSLMLSIDAVGYSTLARESIALPTSGALDLGTLRLAPRPVVRVLVTTAATGEPLAGAKVTLNEVKPDRKEMGRRNRAAFSAKTDAGGRCTINAMLGQEVRLRVTADGLAPFAGDVMTLPDDADAEIHAVMLEGGLVHATTKDAAGEVAAGLSVRHRDPNGMTSNKTSDAKGHVDFANLAPGPHGFRIGADNEMAYFGPPREEPSTDEGWSLVEVADHSTQSLELTKAPDATLVGIVRENGIALAGANVAVVPAADPANGKDNLQREQRRWQAMRGQVSTDANGHYELKGLSAGEYELLVSHESRAMSASVAVSLRLGSNTCDADLPTTILRGTVRGPDGKPVAEASVQVAVQGDGMGNHSVRSVKSGSDGRYELRGVQDGVDLTVSARAKGFAEGTSPAVRVSASAERDGCDITLPGAGRIEVHVSAAAEGATRAFAVREGDKNRRSVSGRVTDGKAVIEGLLPGRWRVSLRPKSGEPVLVDVVAGQTATVRF